MKRKIKLSKDQHKQLEAILGDSIPQDVEVAIEIHEPAGSRSDPTAAVNIRRYLLEHQDAVARRNMKMTAVTDQD